MRAHLEQRIPECVAMARRAGEILRKVIREHQSGAGSCPGVALPPPAASPGSSGQGNGRRRKAGSAGRHNGGRYSFG